MKENGDGDLMKWQIRNEPAFLMSTVQVSIPYMVNLQLFLPVKLLCLPVYWNKSGLSQFLFLLLP